MAIGVRDITNLEELLEVQDDDKIIVIQNGEAKLVSKANAKFGGGTATLFYVDPNDKSDTKRLVDVNGNPISAQAAYDAVMSGPVYISSPELEISSNKTAQENTGTDGFFVLKINGDVVSVEFNASTRKYYAGANMNEGGAL